MKEMIMQLIEEDSRPDEMFLEDMVEEAVDAEQSAISQDDDAEEEIMLRIDNGERMGYDEPIIFSDDVNSAVFDDLADDNDK